MQIDLVKIFILLILITNLQGQGQAQLPNGRFYSNNLDVGNKFTWEVNSYQNPEGVITEPTSESFPIVQGSIVELEVIGDTDGVNLINDTVQTPVDLSSIFIFTVDDIEQDLSKHISIVYFIFPIISKYENGTIDDLFQRENPYLGGTYNSQNELVVSDEYEDQSVEINSEVRYDRDTGIVNYYRNFVNLYSVGITELEITRLDNSVTLIILGVAIFVIILIAIIYLYKRRSNRK